MSIFAELHDGRKLEFPDGTDPLVIQRTVKKMVGTPEVPTPTVAATEAPAEPKAGLLDMLSAPFEMGANFARQPLTKQAEVLGPTVEALGAGGGAILGTPAGPLGTVASAGVGYAAAKELMRHLTGQAKPETLPQATGRVGSTALEGASLEAAGRGIVAPVISKAAQAAGWVWDAASGQLTKVGAGKTARKIAGADLDKIKALAANADPRLTAAQATQPAGNNVLAALGERAAADDTTNFFTRTLADQEAARDAAISAVKPNLSKALGNRTAGGVKDYGKAVAQGIDQNAADAASAQFESLMRRPSIMRAQQTAKALAAEKDITLTDFGSVEGLDWLKKGLDNEISAAAKLTSSKGKAELGALMQTKDDLLATMKEIAPGLDVARARFAKRSIPVNQAQILGEMQTVLAKPGGGERVVPFLNAMGKGEDALIKRSGGNPRFGGLDEALSPKQMGVVNSIAAEFNRDLALASSAAAGKGGLSRILGESKSNVELPPSIGLFTRTANKVLSLLEGKVNTGTMDALTKGMRSGKDLLTVLNTLPAAERLAALQALSAQSKGFGRAATFGTNAMVQDSQNAMAQ